MLVFINDIILLSHIQISWRKDLTISTDNQNESLIKSKSRVQKHGEVFTPKKIVKLMLDQPGIKEACEDLTATFLEPAAGEGAFLVAILERKLKMVAKKFNKSIKQFENYSLLALSTLYGIELLEDNAQACTINMFQKFNEFYLNQVQKYGTRANDKVLASAKTIITANIEQGNFLTRKKPSGKPIVFSEWKAIDLDKGPTTIRVQRTEYTLDDIYENALKSDGEVLKGIETSNQENFFDLIDRSTNVKSENVKSEGDLQVAPRYVETKIIDVYLEEMEESSG